MFLEGTMDSIIIILYTNESPRLLLCMYVCTYMYARLRRERVTKNVK